MSGRPAEISPKSYARVGGALYLIIIAAGLFAEMLRDRLVVSGDAAATASNIMASEPLWRLAFAGEQVMLLCDVGVTLILYVLLKPVNRNLALLAAFFRLVSIVIEGINTLNHLAAVLFLGGAGYLTAFPPPQLQALALLSVKLHGHGYGISLVFFGVHCLFLGYLIFRSGYFPRVLGVLLATAGPCYLINSFALFLAPTFAARIFPAILIPAGLAEYLFCMWLLVRGLNVQKWNDKASAV